MRCEFQDHIEKLLPNPRESKILIDFIAFQLQKPKSKVHWAPILEGISIFDRAYICNVARKALGEQNVLSLNSDNLEDFLQNSKDNHKRLIIGGEIDDLDPEAFLKFKIPRNKSTEENRYNFLFFVSDRDTLPASIDMQRYCILFNKIAYRAGKINSIF